MPQFKNIYAGLKQLYASVGYDKTIVMPDTSGTVSLVGKTETLVGKTLTSPIITSPVVTGANATGVIVAKKVLFTQISGGLTYTGSVPVPAGAVLVDIQITSPVLWGGASAAMDVGDAADPNGYFAAIDVKATDLAVGEVLSMFQGSIDTDGLWGGKQGAYLVAATGRRGLTSATNSGNYYGTADVISGVITVGTPGTATGGRTVMTVFYVVPETFAQVTT